MQVRATRMGYYKHKRRREGEVFHLVDAKKDFSEKWMEKLEEKADKEPVPRREPKKNPGKASDQQVI